MRINLQDYELVKSKDKKTKGLPDPWNLSWLKSKQWDGKRVDARGGKRVNILIILESVFSPDLSPANKHRCLLGAEKSRIFVEEIMNDAIKRAEAVQQLAPMVFSFACFNHLPWFSLDKDKQTMAIEQATKRMRRIIKGLAPDRIICMGDRAAAALLNNPRAKFRRGNREAYNDISMFVGIDLAV